MGVQFDSRGKIKNYNYNGTCVLLDEPCFKHGVDCSPCTRIQEPKHKSIEAPIPHVVEVIKTPVSEPISIQEPLIEPINKIGTVKFESIPKIISNEDPTKIIAPEVKKERFNYELTFKRSQRSITNNSTSVLTKKKNLWARLTGFIKSIFKPRNKKPYDQKPKQSPKRSGKIYVWKNRKEGFGKKRVRNL